MLDLKTKKIIKKTIFIISALAISLVLSAIIIYTYEYHLRKTDTFLNMNSFDSAYFERNKKFYSGLITPPDKDFYSWGVKFKNELIAPQQWVKMEDKQKILSRKKDSFKILVLGDSFTWGPGLKIGERYTDILEILLNDHNKVSPSKKVEVFNVAYMGAPFIKYVERLKSILNIFKPDLILIGFCYNDPQPRSEDFRIEKENFKKKYDKYIIFFEDALIKVGLKLTALSFRRSLDNFFILIGVYPRWEEGMERVYKKNPMNGKHLKKLLMK